MMCGSTCWEQYLRLWVFWWHHSTKWWEINQPKETTKSERNISNVAFFPLVGRSETARASGELYAASVLSGMSQQLWQDVDYVAVNISYLLVVIFSLVTAAIWVGNKLTSFLCVLTLEVSGFQTWVLSFFWMRIYLTCLVVKLDLKLDLCDEIHMRFYCVLLF